MTFEQLKTLASRHFKVTTSQIESKGRKAEVVYARIAIANVLHEKGYTLHEIAAMLNMSHSNVMHYINTFEDRMQYDVIFANTYNDFKEDCD